MKFIKSYRNVLLSIFAAGFISACSDSDDDHAKQASVIPAVNPGFTTITAVKKSTTPAGTYSDVAGYTYDATTERITLPENAIDVGGNYLKITGTAKVHDTAETYTVMTFVKDNDTSIAAHELTSLAVAMVDTTKTTMDTFEEAVLELAESTGLSAEDIKIAMTEQQRKDFPNIQQTMNELAHEFEGNDLDLTKLAAVKAPNMDMIAWGALIYDDWMKAPAEMPVLASADPAADPHAGHHKPSNKVDARNGGEESSNLEVKLTGDKHLQLNGVNHTGFNDFTRCSQCHGWDQKGKQGGFKNREQRAMANLSDSTDTNTETNSAAFESGPLPADIDLTNPTEAYKAEDVTKQTAGVMYAGIETAITGDTAKAASEAWNAAVTEDTSDKHPDFTLDTTNDTGATKVLNDGTVNPIVPTKEKIEALVAFLNYEGGKPDKVFSSFTDGQYTIDTEDMDEEHMIEHGEEYYANYCFRCHGAPNNSQPNPLTGKGYANFKAYLTKGDALNHENLGAIFHFARWGKPSGNMNRVRIGAPSAHDVAGILTYLKSFQAAGADSKLLASTTHGIAGVGNKDTGEAFYYAKCAGCHAANSTALTVSDSVGTSNAGADKTFRCHIESTDSIADVDSEGSCGTNHKIPNLGLLSSNAKMTHNLKSLNKNMGLVNGNGKITQQNINDLAAFFKSLASGS